MAVMNSRPPAGGKRGDTTARVGCVRCGRVTASGAQPVRAALAAGQPWRVVQGGLWAQYSHYSDGRVGNVTRSNGTWTEYTYNFADLRTAILHYNATGGLMLGLQVQFNAAGQVVSRAEWDATGDIAVTSYEHDARGQLYHEHFDPTAADAPTLDYVYTYDGNGNRPSKVVESTYYY